MLTSEEKNKLLKELSERKERVSELKLQLSEINIHKEKWFKEKDSYNKQISSLIKQIRSDRSKRNSFTKQIKFDKEKRDKLNKEASDKINQINKLNQEKRELLKKYNITGDPFELKKQIDDLEHTFEIEVFSIEQEKKIMKEIKELKKKFSEVKSLVSVWEKGKNFSEEVRRLKKEKDSIHNKIQTQAKQGQEKHEAIITSSKGIDELKEKEAKAFEQFLKYKKDFTELNEKLKDELSKMSLLNTKVNSDRKQQKQIEEKKNKELIETKEKNVEEKIKKRKKLTTEDLLILQKGSNFK